MCCSSSIENNVPFKYHEKCLQLIKNPKEIKTAQCYDPVRLSEECVIKHVARSIRNLLDKFWTWLELHELYQKNEGEKKATLDLPQSGLLIWITNFVFTSRGISSTVMLQEKTSSMFKLSSEDSNDNDDVLVQRIACRIKEEIKMMLKRKSEYNAINAKNERSSLLIVFVKTFSLIWKALECWYDRTRSHSNISTDIPLPNCNYRSVYWSMTKKLLSIYRNME